MSDLGFNTEVVSGAKKNHDLTSRIREVPSCCSKIFDESSNPTVFKSNHTPGWDSRYGKLSPQSTSCRASLSPPAYYNRLSLCLSACTYGSLPINMRVHDITHWWAMV